jgi:DNA (cytosine-5)-methyltransferase 1
MKKSEADILEELETSVAHMTLSTLKRLQRRLSSAKTPRCKDAETIPPTILDAIETVVNNASSNKYLFSILLTCCVEKLADPAQDIRIAQDRMPGGYSNRSLDQRIVTPFLKRHGYTHCEASGLESGRNMERPLPWDLGYPTNPRGKGNREAFLGILHHIEKKDGDPKNVAVYLLHYDKSKKQRARKTIMAPREPRIIKIVSMLERHLKESVGQGKSRLPVLAVYAVYKSLVRELARYEGTKLLPLERHTTADLRSESIGDIAVELSDHPFEGVEVKSEKPITANMVEELPRKFAGREVSRYYILSTSTQCVREGDSVSVEEAIRKVEDETGTQVIANGLVKTLTYYLRLLRDPSGILQEYGRLVAEDPDVRPEIREVWNQIVEEEYGEPVEQDP